MQQENAIQVAFGVIATVIGIATIWLSNMDWKQFFTRGRSGTHRSILPQFEEGRPRSYALNHIRAYEMYQMHTIPQHTADHPLSGRDYTVTS
ncbi:hypothetical protein Slin15195_G099180 [Septoria linicola]|uniref:Uncharacterized protein n=1 Tax=Septoria linicola TaxID=215465 RepID=A0A9Q9AW89_9PEZI|nr:hypothetical protein Slin14017_G062240 [Septoria linicola]USW56599.1 hypothetical protein Slin15195_G099180 [Septoria linicola]